MLLQRVKKDLVRFGLIREGERVLLGLSGGMDSMCLLDILCRLKEEIPFSLEAAHLNHMIRGKSAEEDAHFSKKECEKRGVLCHIAVRDIPTLSKERGEGLEECGRYERYQFFRSLGADKIAVAHHLDDQAETVLMHLLRGSGADGLSGMDRKRGDIIRPLLGIRRKELEEYARLQKISWREDESNQSMDYFRNRVRRQVMPLLEELQPGAAEKIVACSDKIRLDNEFLWECAQSADLFRESDECSASVKELCQMEMAVRRRVIKNMLSLAPFVGSSALEECEKLLWSDTGKKVTLSGGFVLERSYDRLVVHREEEYPTFSFTAHVGEEVLLPDGRVLWVGETDEDGLSLDGEKIPYEFTVRSRKSGDKFIPSGMKGSKKVKDFFIDCKIPRKEREKAVILEGDDGIFCVAPYRVSENVKCTKETKKILKIKIKGKE